MRRIRGESLGRIVGAALMTVLAGLADPALGAPARLVAPSCTPADGEPVTVRAVNDDFSLALADGRTVRLAGIDPVASTPTHPDAATRARERLAGWLAGRTVLLRPLGETTDRWGRLPALVFADPEDPDDGDGLSLSVALRMVEAGLARGRPEPDSHACWSTMLAAEAKAREAALGLWADPYYAVRNADDLSSLAMIDGTMAIVRGRVAHVGQSRSQTYLDLGPRHGAVALRLGGRSSFILGQVGASQDGAVGMVVRARGLLDGRFGPEIAVDDADQIERLDGPSAGALRAAP